MQVPPDGTRALSGSDYKTLKLWDTRSGECMRSFEGHAERVAALAMSADGARALSGTYDKPLKLWDTRSGALRCVRQAVKARKDVSAVSW